MANLYGSAASSNPETEQISSFLNQLVHNSNSPSSSPSCMQFRNKYIDPFPTNTQELSTPATNSGAGLLIQPEDRHLLGRSAVQSESEPQLNFYDPETYFGANNKDNADNTLSSAGDFSCDSEAAETSDAPTNQDRRRSSSKRSRAAEVHNLSEKRRRSRINEKMKALQNLIPNSNKTDKASMLDEAIDYLKQLQLQVQMLSMRNRLSLYPVCLPRVLQPMQLPPTGMGYDEGNGFFSPNTGAGIFSSNEESSMNTPLNLSNPCTISNQPNIVPSVANMSNLQASFGFDSSGVVHYRSFSHSATSKEICKESQSQLQLEMNHNENNSSSGVS